MKSRFGSFGLVEISLVAAMLLFPLFLVVLRAVVIVLAEQLSGDL